jgi:hypothetical protein
MLVVGCYGGGLMICFMSWARNEGISRTGHYSYKGHQRGEVCRWQIADF